VTPKGVAVLESLPLAEIRGQPRPVEEYNPPVPVTPPERWRALFESHRLWMRHGERCLSCRICTYVCPTCRCYDVVDRVVDVRPGLVRTERIRVWDACTSPNYRRWRAATTPARPTGSGCATALCASSATIQRTSAPWAVSAAAAASSPARWRLTSPKSWRTSPEGKSGICDPLIPPRPLLPRNGGEGGKKGWGRRRSRRPPPPLSWPLARRGEGARGEG
jgi:ferredoxin